MTPKERVLISHEHKEPDKVPKLSSFMPEFANRLRKHFKMDGDLFNPHGGTHHSALVYGDAMEEIISFGKIMGWNTVTI